MTQRSANQTDTYIVRKFRKLTKKAIRAYRVWILRDPFPVEVRRWFKDNGDDTLRLDYELNKQSVVFDVGGYLGDFTQKIADRYDCYIFIFEPSRSFFETCRERFAGNHKIQCFNFGLGDLNEEVQLSDAGDASSIKGELTGERATAVSIRKLSEVVEELNVEHVDLIKINIEGGEFDLLPHMMDEAIIDKFDNIQVQFHSFIKNSKSMRRSIVKKLKQTHKRDWCYTFVWESWSKS